MLNSCCCCFCDHAGVAFSKNVSSSTDNIGYIIPYAIVEHFLSEYMAQGSYQGICSPGFYTQPMENPAQQQYLKVGLCYDGLRLISVSWVFQTQGPALQYLKLYSCLV